MNRKAMPVLMNRRTRVYTALGVGIDEDDSGFVHTSGEGPDGADRGERAHRPRPNVVAGTVPGAGHDTVIDRSSGQRECLVRTLRRESAHSSVEETKDQFPRTGPEGPNLVIHQFFDATNTMLGHRGGSTRGSGP